MVRIEVAVGMSRLRSMASTRAAWGPRSGVPVSPGARVGAPAAGAGGWTGDGVAGAVRVGPGAVTADVVAADHPAGAAALERGEVDAGERRLAPSEG